MKMCRIKAYNGKQQDGKKRKRGTQEYKRNGNGARKEEMKR